MIDSIHGVELTIKGHQVQQLNSIYFWSTIAMGVFCIFPMSFMFFAWWKKLVLPIYELDYSIY